MRVLLIGEGPHDIGQQEWSHRDKAYVSLPGWLHTAIGILQEPGQKIEISALSKREIVLGAPRRRLGRPLPKGHGAKALAAAYRAASGGYDVVVFMTDADTRDVQVWERHHKDITEGFRLGPANTAKVVCLPKSASESWVLADPKAWRMLGLTNTAALPRRPEDTWGERRDPTSGHPKHAFERAARDAGLAGDGRTQRVAVMAASDPQTIAAACGKSFLGFWRECAAAGLSRPAPPP